MKKILNKNLFLFINSLIILLLLFSIKHIFPFKKNYPDLRNKHIVVYVALREEEAKYLLELFKKETGCTYEYIKLPTEEAVMKILDEKTNPKGNIFIGGTCDGYELLKNYNLLEKYKSPNAKNISSNYMDSDGYWTGFEIDPLSIAINKESWNNSFGSKNISMPKTFNDLINPMYKGKIIIPDPKTSGTGYTFMAYLYQQLGEEYFCKFIKQLKNNINRLTISGFNSIQLVSSGEYILTVNFLGDQKIMNKSDMNIINIIPKNTGWNVNAVAAIKNNNNDEATKAFIDFCLSDEIANKLSSFSMATSTKNFKSMDYKIFKNYNFKKAAYDRNNIMNIWDSK
ncbi:ABC transporter substrate-binding protein [Clostridium botulinum]|uniref:ABC transporter substrate-binding protein n=1 Tax=Clostridium botulinum TaxID=1491 RepID=UPI00052C03F9|nr:ABC transporter substrate-binding protein [Clostridium botulinum]KGM94465.1 ABC transporter substrate-binding protein [Clostridium botulinum D str. CCUG 7971]NFO98645.1 ABC transporter substrate-binding protein [Clostridium botulinum]OOV50795.1 ABC transporter substrate-binding protein [Clostridium botulinum D/C]OOV53283.1 ABC transporter substrate-binding protein [Clostridium botulinum D/C]OOV57865.1 ABC transporter substrate-binding protein [Clostridium botulinum D/C]